MPKGIYIRTKEMRTGKYARSNYHKLINSQGHIGQIPWNKGLKTPIEVRNKQSKSRIGKKPWNKGKFKLDTYYGLHNWVKHVLGKPSNCEFCGSNRFVEWANKSNEYKPLLSDWLRLCRKCHMKYDSQFGIRRNIYG